MKNNILKYFSHASDCFQVYSQSFGVKDNKNDNLPAFVVLLNEQEIQDFPKIYHHETDIKANFLVKNEKVQEIHFLAIDACLLKNQKDGQCDFAVFSEKDFVFVEIKEVSKKQRAEAKEKAVKQLKNTLSLFIQKGISFESYNLYAGIAFLALQTYSQSYPKAKCSRANDLAFFENEYNATLLEINTFEFE